MFYFGVNTLVSKNGQKKVFSIFNNPKKVSSTSTVDTVENQNNPDDPPSFSESMKVSKFNYFNIVM